MRLRSKSWIASGIAVILMIVLCCLAAFAQEQLRLVAGRLVLPNGKPAADLKVTFSMLTNVSGGKTEDVSVTTDADGVYRVELKPSDVWAKAERGDYLLFQHFQVGGTQGDTIRKDFSLIYSCLVLGEVTDSTTALPIEGAEVCVYGNYGASTTTSKEGTFRLRVPPVAGLELMLEKDGYGVRRINFGAEGQDIAPFRIALVPGGTVSGRVVDENGQPYSGVTVATVEDQVYATNTAVTDNDGYYRIADVSTDKFVMISARVRGGGPIRQQAVKFPDGSREATYDFTVKRVVLRNIEGIVSDASGGPVAGASVRFGTSTCDGERKVATTDASGAYKLGGVSPQSNMILVQAEGYAPAFLPVGDKGDERIDVKLENGHTAGGRIVDAAGNPVPDTSISVCARTPVLGRLYSDAVQDADVYRWLAARVVPDENGNFTMTNLPASGVVLDTYAVDHIAPQYVAIRVDSRDNVIVMRGIPQVAGKVVDAETGKPVRGFTVAWGSSYSANSVFNTEDGSFVVKMNNKGSIDQTGCTVKVSAKGYMTEEKVLKVTEAPALDSSAEFRLMKAVPVTGRVVDASGRGVEGAKVSIMEKGLLLNYVAESASMFNTTTDKDGMFTFDSAPASVAGVLVEKEGFPQTAREDVDLTKPVEIVLAAPAKIEVCAKRFSGVDSSVTVTVNKENYISNLPQAKLSVDGSLTLTGLDAGVYLVKVSGNRMESSKVVKLKAGESAVMDFDAGYTASVKGVVTRKGVPLAGAKVYLDLGNNDDTGVTNSRSDSGITDSTGRFEILTDKSGPVTVECYDLSVRTIPIARTVVIKAGDNTLDLALPAGVISGRVVDAKTGKPVVDETVTAQARWEEHPIRSYSSTDEMPAWGRPMSYTKTDRDGSFTLEGVSGEVVLAIVRDDQAQKFIGEPVTVGEGQAVTGITIELDEPGKVDLSVVDAESGKPVEGGFKALVSTGGVLFFARSNFCFPESVPPGQYTAWEPGNSQRMPSRANIEVKSGQTAKVKMEVAKARQRLVFSVASGSRFSGTKGAWVGYSIRDAATGKAVLDGPFGPAWGGMQQLDAAGTVSIPLKPGTYQVEAVLRDTDDYAVDSKANLWTVKKRVVVSAGQDTVIAVE